MLKYFTAGANYSDSMTSSFCWTISTHMNLDMHTRFLPMEQ